jgi:hypothetical protein
MSDKNKKNFLRQLAKTAKPVADISCYSMDCGIYAFFLVKDSITIGRQVFAANDDTPLYVGKTESSQKARDAGQHLSDSGTGSSTLRRSLGAILRENLKLNPRARSDSEKSSRRFTNYKFDPAGENALTAWMRAHLSLGFCELPKLTLSDLGASEKSLIKSAVPALNILHNSESPYYADLKLAREQCVELARRSIAER